MVDAFFSDSGPQLCKTLKIKILEDMNKQFKDASKTSFVAVCIPEISSFPCFNQTHAIELAE